TAAALRESTCGTRRAWSIWGVSPRLLAATATTSGALTQTWTVW
ncbi:unnamed protein product, partial [Tetraodon nigroviridis]